MGVDYTASLLYGYVQKVDEYDCAIPSTLPSPAFKAYDAQDADEGTDDDDDDDYDDNEYGDNWGRAYQEEFDTEAFAQGCAIEIIGTTMDRSDYNRGVLYIDGSGFRAGYGEATAINPSELVVQPEWKGMLDKAAAELGLDVEGLEPGWFLGIKQW